VICDGVVLPSLVLSLKRGCHRGGAEALRVVDPKSVEKNIVRISHEI